MARSPRLALAGELHYLVQRGHNQQSVFVDDSDREAYLRMLRDAVRQYGVAIHAYALLASEVHLLATPPDDQSLSRTMQSLGRRYVAAFNRRHGRMGTLWAGRFRAGLIESGPSGVDAMVHIESMPVRAGLAPTEIDWPWSSAAHNVGHRRDPLVSEHPAYWALGNTPFERELAHAHRLKAGLSFALAEGLQAAALQGRTWGSSLFADKVSALSGLSQQRPPRGRPSRTERGQS
ncbi:MAG TPA: transposase [Burkholderiaceae bacterium]